MQLLWPVLRPAVLPPEPPGRNPCISVALPSGAPSPPVGMTTQTGLLTAHPDKNNNDDDNDNNNNNNDDNNNNNNNDNNNNNNDNNNK